MNFESDHHTSANAKTSRFYQERAFVAEIVSNGNLRENICIEKEQNHCSHVDHYLANRTLSTVKISIARMLVPKKTSKSAYAFATHVKERIVNGSYARDEERNGVMTTFDQFRNNQARSIFLH